MNAITNEDENIRFQNEKSDELSVEIESLKQAKQANSSRIVVES